MNPPSFSRSKLSLVLAITGLLGACGGGGGGSNNTKPSSTPIASSSQQPASSSSTSTVNSSITATSSSAGVASISNFIVVDQFGYLPDAQKIAVIRDPQTGYDADKTHTPGVTLALVNMVTGETVLSGTPITWNNGATDNSSGDKAWWFDFSSVTTAGTYAVVDTEKNIRSPSFKIAADVYKPVLKEAFRTFFYQRAGQVKATPYAETQWADGASHMAAGQDTQARLYNEKGNAATEKDLSGGWYDAGDYNKYTSWAADYVITLLHAYIENPSAWEGDFNIPESTNQIPDILVEVKRCLEWLIKMQNATRDNSVLSIPGLF